MSPFNPPRNYQGAGKYAVPPNFQVGNVQFNQPDGMEGSSPDNGQEMVQENVNRYPTNTYDTFNQGMLIPFFIWINKKKINTKCTTYSKFCI